MRPLHYMLSISSAAALLSACGGSQPPIAAPGGLRQTAAFSARTDSTKYRVVYSFGVAPDGASPRASVIDVGDTLYGTTVFGGPHICISSVYGCGTVFSISAGGTEKVLYGFGKNPDGSAPEAGLINVSGSLYGTTRVWWVALLPCIGRQLRNRLHHNDGRHREGVGFLPQRPSRW